LRGGHRAVTTEDRGLFARDSAAGSGHRTNLESDRRESLGEKKGKMVPTKRRINKKVRSGKLQSSQRARAWSNDAGRLDDAACR